MRYDRLRYDSIERLPFDLVGEFLGFVWDKQDQPRALRLLWLGKEIIVKVSKSLRGDRYDGWIPGMQVEVWGQQKFSKKKAKLKLSADRLAVKGLVTASTSDSVSAPVPTLTQIEIQKPIVVEPIVSQSRQVTAKPPTIKVCGKSDCMRRGGKAMCETLGKALKSGDYPAIEVQFTGCMGKCSQGPNLVVMPDKKRYTKVTARDIPQVLETHFQCRR